MEISNYDKRHLQHLQKVEQRIQKLYHAAIERIAKLVNTATRLEDSTYRLEEDKSVNREVQRILSTLASDTETAITNGIKDEWYLSDEKNAALMRSVFGSHQPKEEPQAYLTNRTPALTAFLKRKSKGLDLSDRVWKLTKEYKHEIEYALEIAIREGKSAAQTASLMKRYLNRPNELYRRVRNKQGKLVPSKRAKQYHPGQGIYRSSYQNARRLAATETNMAYRIADHERWQQMDFVVGIKISLSNNHTCNGRPFHDICDELVGVYPKTFKFGGWHPLCRCFATPILKTEEEMEEDDRRLARGEAPTTTSKNEVTELPKVFEDWFDRNSEKIATATQRGKAPYFISNNKGYIKSKDIRDTLIKNETSAVIHKAREVGNTLQRIAGETAKKYGAKVTPLNYKGEGSIIRKTNLKLIKNKSFDVHDLKDTFRNTIVCEKSNIDTIFDALRSRKDCVKWKIQSPEDFAGYSGRIVNLKMKNGLVGEIQVNTPKMIYAKEPPEVAKSIIGNDLWGKIHRETGLECGLGHKYYEIIRDAKTPKHLKDKYEKLSIEYYSHFSK